MSEIKEIEIWLAVNEDCDAEAATDADEARERLDENWGGYTRRMYKIKVKVQTIDLDEDGVEVELPDQKPEAVTFEAE